MLVFKDIQFEQLLWFFTTGSPKCPPSQNMASCLGGPNLTKPELDPAKAQIAWRTLRLLYSFEIQESRSVLAWPELQKMFHLSPETISSSGTKTTQVSLFHYTVSLASWTKWKESKDHLHWVKVEKSTTKEEHKREGILFCLSYVYLGCFSACNKKIKQES